MMLYLWARGLVRFFLTVVYCWQVEGKENLPEQGAVIVVANHSSNLDPPAVGAALSREVRFMAKEELFRYPLFGPLLRSLGAFPVSRGAGDRTAIRRSMAILQAGEVLGMFPEGTRQRGSGLGAPQPGAALLALKSRALLLPVGVKKARGWKRLQVRIGAPFTLADEPGGEGVAKKVQLKQAGERIMQEIFFLLEKK